jgi:hypothetical protein
MVIYRAMQEAEGTYTIQPTTRTERRYLEQHQARLRNEARMWLTNDTFGLRVVFEFASLPNMKYREFIASNLKRFGGRND